MKDQLYIIDSTFCAELAKFQYTWLKSGETVKVETLESLEHQQAQMVDEMDDEVEEEQENQEVKRSGFRPRIPKLMAKTSFQNMVLWNLKK